MAAPHSKQVQCSTTRRLTGSVALDAELRRDPSHSRAARWDYGIGYASPAGVERALWIEIHPANTSEVSRVLEKLAWLKRWLHEEAVELGALTTLGHESSPGPYVWLATESGTHIQSGSSAARRLAQAGLDRPRRTLRLP